MANALFDSFKELQLSASALNLATADVRAILIDETDYTVNLATHDFLDDVPAAAREEVSGAFTSLSITGGAYDAADITFSGTSGDACDAILIYQHTGTDSTSSLIAYIDTASGLPVSLGGDVTVTWGTNIFAL